MNTNPLTLQPHRSLFDRFAPAIAALPDIGVLSKDVLLSPSFLLREEHTTKRTHLQIYYTPFDCVNPSARVAIVGLTPGLTQMELAIRTARDGLKDGKSAEEIAADIERQASFAGSMKTNLITMLDGIGLPQALGAPSTISLFEQYRALIHTTSVVRYATFVNGRNYTGGYPSLIKTPMLMEYIHVLLREELQILRGALVIPLGKAVSQAVQTLIADGTVRADQCLLHFPHPSGVGLLT